MEFTPVNFEDFSGGMTDQVVGGEANQGEIVENFHITAYKKLKSREGSEADTTYGNMLTTLKPAGGTGNIINFQKDSALLVRTKDKLFVPSGGNWANITGPNGNNAFVSGTTFTSPGSYVSHDEWDQHHFLVGYDDSTGTNSFARPIKLYQDINGIFQVLNAGLPKFPDNTDATSIATILASAITLANNIKSVMNTHFSSAAGVVDPTKAHYTSQPSISTTNASDLPTLIALTKDLVSAYQTHVRDARFIDAAANSRMHYDVSTHTTDFQTALNFDVPFTGAPISAVTCAQMLNNLKLCFNLHEESYNPRLDTFVAGVQNPNLHPVSTGKVTAPDVVLYPTPVFTMDLSTLIPLGTGAGTRGSPTPTDPTLAVMIDAADQLRWALGNHYTNNNGAYATHSSSINYLTLHTYQIYDRFTMIAGLMKTLDSYNWHIQQDALHTGGPNAATTTLQTSGLLFTQKGDGGTLTFPDPSTSTGCATLWNIIKVLRKAAMWHTGGANAGNTALHTGTVDTNALAMFPAFTQFTNPTFGSFVYSFIYKNKYKVLGSIEFENDSTPGQSLAVVWPYNFSVLPIANYPLSALANDDNGSGVPVSVPQKGRITITSIPTLPTTENLPTATATKEIYRTKDTNTVFYQIASLNNSVTTFTDDVPDSSLVLPLYTTGGVVANDPPPKSKCFVIGPNETGYYGGVVELDETGAEIFLSRRVRQSLVGVPDSCPEEFFVDLDNEVMTLGMARGVVVAVTSKAVYRLDGQMDERGNGAITAVRIADNIGGVSVNAGVTHNDVFYFAGDDGFFMTDGYKVFRLSRHLTTTYSNLVASNKGKTIQACLDRDNHKIYWSANQGSTGYNDVLFELNLQIPLVYLEGDDDEARGAFTRHSNGTHFAPTAIGFFNGSVYRGDYQGFLFKHTSADLADPEVSRAAGGTLTGDVVNIPWKWRSVALSFGTIAVQKFAPYVNFTFANHGNLSVQPNSINDLNTGNIRALNPIRYRGGGANTITAKRTFPTATDSTKRTGGLRFMYKQVEIQAADVFILSSDDSSPVTLASTSTNHAVLDTSSFVWPQNLGNYRIGFGPSYGTFYPIVSRVSNDTLLLTGSPGIAGSQKWEIRGTPHDEVCELLGVTLFVAPYGQMQPGSPAGIGGNT